MMEKSDSQQCVEQVIATGSSWVVCRSKSHNGRVYYFNTSTGEAAWNLSEAEMEKARRSMRGINIGACPEPSEPPTDHQREGSSSTLKTKIYNNQIINNQFPRQNYPIAPVMVPTFNTVPSISQNSVGPTFPVAVNSVNSGFNLDDWTAPPPQQILYVNQGQTPLNVRFNNQNPMYQPEGMNIPFRSSRGRAKEVTFNDSPYIHNTRSSQRRRSLSTCRETGAPTYSQPKRRRSFSASREYASSSNRSYFERRRSFSTSPNKYQNKNYSSNRDLAQTDLRRRLSARKNLHLDCEEGPENNYDNYDWNTDTEFENYQEEVESSREEMVQRPQMPVDEHVDADGDWIEEHFFVEDGLSKLDVTNLRKLAKPNMNLYPWYIVADKDVLLNHLNLLITLWNSDDYCCLMVPRIVLGELQDEKDQYIRRIATRAERAINFIMQHADAEGQRVVIGDADCDETDTKLDYLINCCLNLSEQKYHVLLLSNDEALKFLKYAPVHIFSIKELKQVLTTNGPVIPSPVKQDRLKPPPCLKAKPLNVSFSDNIADKQKFEVNSEVYSTKVITDSHATVQQHIYIPNKDTADQEIETTTYSDSQACDSSKGNKSETAVQTEDIFANECHSFINTFKRSNMKASPRENLNSDDVQPMYSKFTSTDTNQNKSTFNRSNMEASPRENLNSDDVQPMYSKFTSTDTNQNKSEKIHNIRLNRNVSFRSLEQTPVAEKKQFRWRRSKHISGSCPTNDKLLSTNQNEKEISSSTSNHPDKQQYLLSDESLLSDVSITQNRNTTTVNVTVKESSNSGISNTTSNVDSSVAGGLADKLKQNKGMSQVKHDTLEDSLRVKIDEWLPRFKQTMEETLTQILQSDKKFLKEVYHLRGGGPWALIEATVCIRLKYENNSNIINAAKKLSRMLTDISDSDGRIDVNLGPSMYMELYYYGLRLVEALAADSSHGQDLEPSLQSLLKLRDDIMNPDLDESHNDTFEEHIPEETSGNCHDTPSHGPKETEKNTSTPVKEPETPEQIIQKGPVQSVLTSPMQPVDSSPIQGSLVDRSKQNADCSSLRSKSKKLENVPQQTNEPNKEKPVTFKVTINNQHSFLSRLNLQSNVKTSGDHVENENRNVNNVEFHANTREFTLCPEFENKLAEKIGIPDKPETMDMDKLDYENDAENLAEKIGILHERETLDMDQLDYENDAENSSDAIFDPSEYGNPRDHLDENNPTDLEKPISELGNDNTNFANDVDMSWDDTFNSNQNSTHNEEGANLGLDQGNFETGMASLQINGHTSLCGGERTNGTNGNWKDLPLNTALSDYMVVDKIPRHVVMQTTAFLLEINNEIDRISEELERQPYSTKRKFALRTRTKILQYNIDNMYSVISSLFSREFDVPEDSIVPLLLKFYDGDVDHNLYTVYRRAIFIFSNKVKMLQETAALLLNVIEKKPTS